MLDSGTLPTLAPIHVLLLTTFYWSLLCKSAALHSIRMVSSTSTLPASTPRLGLIYSPLVGPAFAPSRYSPLCLGFLPIHFPANFGRYHRQQGRVSQVRPSQTLVGSVS